MKRNLGLGKHICATIRVQMSKVGTICCSCLPDSFFPFIWGHHILLWGVLWMKQCPPKIHMVKPCPPVYQHLTVIRDRAFKEVCMCVCVCVCVCARARAHACMCVSCSVMLYATPMGFVHEIFQSRLLECVAIPFSR